MIFSRIILAAVAATAPLPREIDSAPIAPGSPVYCITAFYGHAQDGRRVDLECTPEPWCDEQSGYGNWLSPGESEYWRRFLDMSEEEMREALR